MKLLVIGSAAFTDTLARQVVEGIEATAATGPEEAVGLLGASRFDLIILDSRIAEAGASCKRIRAVSQVPIVLSVSESKMEWDNRDYFGVDGFIPNSTSPKELKARLEAIYRRTGR